MFYCPPDGEYDYITWQFDCDEDVFLLPTAAEHRAIEGLTELDELDLRLGIRSSSRDDIAVVIKSSHSFLSFVSFDLSLYSGVDENLDSFLECNGERLELQARDGEGKPLDLTLEGPLPRFDDSIIDSCWENNFTCIDGFACAKCNEDKSVDLVRLVGYERATNRIIEGFIGRTRRGTTCPIDPSVFYDDDYAYVYLDSNFKVNVNDDFYEYEYSDFEFAVNGVSSALLPNITGSKPHVQGVLENSEKIFSCRSSSANVSSTQTSKPDASADVDTLPTQNPVAPTTPEEASSSPSNQATPEGEEVCLEADWLRSAGVRDEHMLHEESIMSRVLCPRTGVPCGTPDHLLLKGGELVSYADLCSREECGSRSALVNSANHLHLMRAAIHFEDVSVTGCSGKSGSWQRWIEELIVRRVYIAHRAWKM